MYKRQKLAGEAQAHVVEVTAEAIAKQTTLEGNAEAGIVLSKGEAEAKALALRAEAYRQFNDLFSGLQASSEINRQLYLKMQVCKNQNASLCRQHICRIANQTQTYVKFALIHRRLIDDREVKACTNSLPLLDLSITARTDSFLATTSVPALRTSCRLWWLL